MDSLTYKLIFNSFDNVNVNFENLSSYFGLFAGSIPICGSPFSRLEFNLLDKGWFASLSLLRLTFNLAGGKSFYSHSPGSLNYILYS